MRIAAIYVILLLAFRVSAQQISDRDVINLKIEAYADFSKNLLHFRLLSENQHLLIELPGCLLDLDSNLNNDLTCIYFTKVNQSSWFKAVGAIKPKEIQGVKITNFAKTASLVERNGEIGLRLFLYTIENNKIQGPKILKNSIKLRNLKEGDLDKTAFHLIPLRE